METEDYGLIIGLCCIVLMYIAYYTQMNVLYIISLMGVFTGFLLILLRIIKNY